MRVDRGDAREFKSVGTPARMTIVTRRLVRSQVSSASYLCDVTTTPYEAIVDNAGFQTKGVNCRLDETRAKWP